MARGFTDPNGQRMVPTSIKLTNDQRIQLRRLGGSQWIRKQIEKASNESTVQSGMAGQSAQSVGKA